jgi:hypothetical protein
MNPRTFNLMNKTAKVTELASDGLAASNFGQGSGIGKVASSIEGATSAASLAKDVYQGASKIMPSVNKVMGGLAEASQIAKGAGNILGAASKAAPIASLGSMALQGIDVARDPAANKAATMDLANKGALGRAFEGFSNPVKTIAGTGQLLGELASLTYNNSLDSYKNKTASIQKPGNLLGKYNSPTSNSGNRLPPYQIKEPLSIARK